MNISVGSGGGSGGTGVGLFVINDTQTGIVAIGNGGTGVSAASGNNGVQSSFLFPASGTPNATLIGQGGQGGDVQVHQMITSLITTVSATIPAINAVFLGGYPIFGQFPGPGMLFAPDVGIQGFGASSFYGCGGYGSGGSGAIQTNNTQTGIGGNGAAGVVIIYEY